MNVYQGNVIDWKRAKGDPHHGQCRAAVAAKNWKAAHAIAIQSHPMSFYYFRNYWSITGNTAQIEAATKNPGKLVVASSLKDEDYEPV